MLRAVVVTQAALLASALPVSHPLEANPSEGPGAHVGALVLPYDPSCSQGEGFLFSTGDASCMASPFKPIAECPTDGITTTACLRRGIGGISSMKYMKVDDESSRSQMMSVTAEAEGGGWGVKVSASVSAQQSSKMSASSTSYVLYGHKDLGNFEVVNAHMLQLTEEAKALIKQGFRAFTTTYGTHTVGYIASGATFYGSFTIYSTDSTSEDKSSISASVEGSYGPFSAKASASFESARNSASSSTKVEGTLRCTGTVECASEVPATPAAMLEMSKTWHNATDKMGTPLKMGIYPLARSAEMAKFLNENAQHWEAWEKDALFGFGLPTAPMLGEWKLQQNEAQLFLKSVETALETWDGMQDHNVIERAEEINGLVHGKRWASTGNELPVGRTIDLIGEYSTGQYSGCGELGEYLSVFVRNRHDVGTIADGCAAIKKVKPEDAARVYVTAPKCTVKTEALWGSGQHCYFRQTKSECELYDVCSWTDEPQYFIPTDVMTAQPSTGRQLGNHPVQCTCANGRKYHVGDYDRIHSCDNEKADWDSEWWKMGGAAACRGGIIKWAHNEDSICDASKTTTIDPFLPLSSVTVGATCSVPEVKLQLQSLLDQSAEYHRKFLDTSLENVISVQRDWASQPSQVFFWQGKQLNKLKQQLAAISAFMDSSLLLLEGVEEGSCKIVDADTQVKKQSVEMLIGEGHLHTPQACAVAVLKENKVDPLKCSDQYMVFDDDAEVGAKCFCLPPATRCTRETKTELMGKSHDSRALGHVKEQVDMQYIFKINLNLPRVD